MALRYGFFNSLLNPNGTYDRTYNAEDYSDSLGAFISNGVLRDENNGFEVFSNGLIVAVEPGYAWINGHWCKLDSRYAFPYEITPPVGENKRIDTVVLRLLTAESERKIVLDYKVGTPALEPQAEAPTREDDVFELVIAQIAISAGATTVSVTDTRPDYSVCGWVTSPIGSTDYFKNLDAAFEKWFTELKTDLAVKTIFRQFTWSTILSEDTNTVTFDIEQYDPEGTDIVEVYANGLRQASYSRDGSTITFLESANTGQTGIKTAGTRIDVVVYQSIDGTGLGSVLDEVAELQVDVASLNKVHKYDFICNGVDDNIRLSDLISSLVTFETGEYGSNIIRVFGTFGASAPYSGAGTYASPYNWFVINGRTTLDFSGCSAINISVPDSSYNRIFAGGECKIIGASVIATGGLKIDMCTYNSAAHPVAEHCRFWITSQDGMIARCGTFRDCRTSLTTTVSNAQSFNVYMDTLLRVFGGEHYAYAPTGKVSSVFYVNSGHTGAVILTYGVNLPTVERSGYVQSYAINCNTQDASCSFTDTITTLSIIADGQNVRGTIAQNKAGLM